jgi:hypothetical protein
LSKDVIKELPPSINISSLTFLFRSVTGAVGTGRARQLIAFPQHSFPGVSLNIVFEPILRVGQKSVYDQREEYAYHTHENYYGHFPETQVEIEDAYE